MVVRKSPEDREFCPYIVYRVRRTHFTHCALAARAQASAFDLLSWQLSFMQRDAEEAAHAAFPGPSSHVPAGRRQPPPALPAATQWQRPYAAHRCVYARRPLHPLLASRANAVRVDHERTASWQRGRR